jgi:hypothetical protein
MPDAHQRHRPQDGMKLTETWSPGLTVRTPGPISITSPEPSCPPIIGSHSVIPICSIMSAGGTRSPVTRCSSEWHRPA